MHISTYFAAPDVKQHDIKRRKTTDVTQGRVCMVDNLCILATST